MSAEDRINRKMAKLVTEVSGYIFKREHEWEMPADEERVAIMGALVGMAIAVGRKCNEAERKRAEQLAVIVANGIRDAADSSAFVGAPGTANIET
jgi:hypothetical protein